MFIRLDKQDSYYTAGETIKGIVAFELFHISAQNELFIKFEGKHILPRHVRRQILSGECGDESASLQEEIQNLIQRSPEGSVHSDKDEKAEKGPIQKEKAIIEQKSDESYESFRGYQEELRDQPAIELTDQGAPKIRAQTEAQTVNRRVHKIQLQKTSADMMKHGLRFGQLSKRRDRSTQKMGRQELSQMSSQISAIQEKDALSDLTPSKPRSSSAHTKKNSMQQQRE